MFRSFKGTLITKIHSFAKVMVVHPLRRSFDGAESFTLFKELRRSVSNLKDVTCNFRDDASHSPR